MLAENKLNKEQHSNFRAYIVRNGIGELKYHISGWIEHPLNRFIDVFKEHNPKWSLRFDNHIEYFQFPSKINGGDNEILDWLKSNVNRKSQLLGEI